MADEPASLIEYPSDFPIKVMGKSQAGFTEAMLAIVTTYAPDFDASTVELKSSKGGKYLSVTCVIRATSREQLDNLYRALCDHPMVVMAL